MKKYVMAYRVNGIGNWVRLYTVTAKSAAGAIAQVAPTLTDIQGNIEISAVQR